ncbi:hypothetical protein OsJ_27196 [Oryza sativa Japonica Group]|uniref:Uncharacterized protein n=1 Tax=Oryza sativa subsp. japonica TaxID=39947 RepID=B9G0R4_ORYSJ|nr:hypothetical protein OsJ_27196 [Oryza sativa Japonica Group]
MVGTAAHGPVVEDSDGEHGGAVLAEDEEVPVAQVVGAGEPQPATAQCSWASEPTGGRMPKAAELAAGYSGPAGLQG